jgi:hypothetical protein
VNGLVSELLVVVALRRTISQFSAVDNTINYITGFCKKKKTSETAISRELEVAQALRCFVH